MRFAILVLGCWISFVTVAHADAEADLALAVSQVCANEATLHASPEDCAMIWQVTRSHGRTAAARLRWLRRHSNCVLTDRPMTEKERKGNCRWSRYLTASDSKPRGWPEGVNWRGLYDSRWARIRQYVRGLVSGATPVSGWPCPEDPDTWGSPKLDMEQALKQGMQRLHCVGTANEGFLFRRRLADS